MSTRRTLSNEWLMGATIGAYAVLSFVLCFWSSAFIRRWCGNDTFDHSRPGGTLPEYLLLLVPAVVVGLLDCALIKFAEERVGAVTQRTVAAALWLNLVGSTSFLILAASNYGPEESNSFTSMAALLGIVGLPLGILFSFAIVVWAVALKFRRWQPSRFPSDTV